MQTKQSTYEKHFQTLNSVWLLNIEIRLQTLVIIYFGMSKLVTTGICLQILKSGLLFLARHDRRPASTPVQARKFQIFRVHANLSRRRGGSWLRGCREPRLVLRRQCRDNRRVKHHKYHSKTSPKMHLVSKK